MTRVIGLISGTSVDGIDAALVSISGSTFDLTVDLIAGATYPYPAALRQQILDLCSGAALSVAELAAVDDAIAEQFAQAALQIQSGHDRAELIGSHGQTVFHRPPVSSGDRPNRSLGYSVQLGRGEAIAHWTEITTISDFRAADIALGGQGAPLVPPVDACLFSHPTLDRCVQNIGGIGNVAFLPARTFQTSPADYFAQVRGWDTGPGNALLDLAVTHLSHGKQTFDREGSWAASGTLCQPLLDQWLQHAFFQQAPPKSTGREEFGQDFFDRCLSDSQPYHLSAADLLATLTELTAESIAQSYRQFLPRLPAQMLVCGGGGHNRHLMQRLQALLPSVDVATTDAVGVSSEFKEAIAFAVLAYWRQQGIPGNLPEATGAKQASLLGEIHPAVYRAACR